MPCWEDGDILVFSSLLHSTGSSTGFVRKNTLPRGKARKDWEAGGQERRPDRSLQTTGGLVELGQYRNCSWAHGKVGTIVLQPKDEGSIHYLGFAWRSVGQGPPLSKEIKKELFLTNGGSENLLRYSVWKMGAVNRSHAKMG